MTLSVSVPVSVMTTFLGRLVIMKGMEISFSIGSLMVSATQNSPLMMRKNKKTRNSLLANRNKEFLIIDLNRFPSLTMSHYLDG